MTSPPITLENLSAGTSYQVRVRAISDIGSGSYSEIRTITTYQGMNSLAISTAYYTFSVPYCVYCSRPESVKCPRASAVNKAIRHRGHVVSSLISSPLPPLPFFPALEFSAGVLSQFLWHYQQYIIQLMAYKNLLHCVESILAYLMN